MRWYQKLFVKVFFATWLISVLLTGGLVYGLLRANESQHWQAMMETRAAGYAQLIIERHETGSVNRHRTDREQERGRGRMPLRITDLESGQILQDFRRPLPPLELLKFILEADNGKRYQIELPAPEQAMHLDRTLKFLLSIQMVLIVTMSTLVALLVSFWVVKPINRLRLFARSLHDEHNLSNRTDSHLSDRKDEIGELAREFDAMAGYVEKALQARQQLLRDVSHELRAPLARLQVATGILEQQNDGVRNPVLAQIDRESEQLALLIDQLLSLSRLDDTAFESTKVIAIKAFMERVTQDYVLLYPDHSIQVMLSPEDIEVELNEALLERIVGNVLENALKYSPVGSLVNLVVQASGKHLIMTVSDQGSGVAEAQLEKIFDPFYRVSDSLSGYGLGLSIVKNAVRRLQGEVIAENNAEGGLTVTIKLPYQV